VDNKDKVTETGVEIKPAEKKSKKKLAIILSIIGGVLLLAGIGFAIWWFAYYNSDKKVLSDAFHNALSSTEGTSDIKMSAKINDSVNVALNIKTDYNQNAVSANIDGKLSAGFVSFDAGIDFIANKDGDLYVKINDLDDTLETFGFDGDDLGLDIDVISDEWIKIGKDDIKNSFTDIYDNLADTIPSSVVKMETDDYSKCFQNVSTALTTNKNTQKEILNSIIDSKLLTAKRVGKDKDGIKFKLAGDLGNSYDLAKMLMDSELYRSFSNCVKETTDITLPITDDLDAEAWLGALSQFDELRDFFDLEIHFWVDAWSHQPTRLSIDVKVDTPDAKVDFNLSVTRTNGKTGISIPKNSTDLTSIIQDFSFSSDLFDFGYDEDYDDFDLDDYDFDTSDLDDLDEYLNYLGY